MDSDGASHSRSGLLRSMPAVFRGPFRNHQVLVGVELLGILGGQAGDVKTPHPDLAGRPSRPPCLVSRPRHDPEPSHFVAAPLEKLEQVRPGEEVQVGLIEQPRRLVGPVAHEERGNDAHVTDIGQTRDDDTTRLQPLPRPFQEPPRFAQVLDHVATDDAIERVAPRRRVEPFHIADQDCPVNVDGARRISLLFLRLGVISIVFDLNARVALSGQVTVHPEHHVSNQ